RRDAYEVPGIYGLRMHLVPEVAYEPADFRWVRMLCCRWDAYEVPGIRGLRMHLMPEIGDPYEEFYKLESFGVEVSIPYCIGQIDAYFEDAVPIDFGTTDAVCVAHDPSWYHSRKISDASSS
ncbi:hypothetical protein NXH58_03425, partial [Agathobacter ruminis]|uniref:hypothetical protein n=1 Tax=Agathobacter ruminis TaxID=1712665 RepID=UPI0023720A38|nr:hypothetical protein [Agathobacter ruminis]